MPGQKWENNTSYLRVVQGNFVQKVEEGTEGAQLRKWETPDGRKGETWEIVYISWEGKLKNIKFKETEYGEMCYVNLDDTTIILNVNSRYFTDFAKKILSADLDKTIIFHPYDLESDEKRYTGISMKQDDEKLKNYFWDGKKITNGFPEVDKSQPKNKNYWKKYFIDVQEFLIKKLKKFDVTEPEGEKDFEDFLAEEIEN